MPLLITLLLLGFSFSSYAQIAPEPPTQILDDAHSAMGTQWMVVTADERASFAANAMLEQGGNAVDASIAAQLMLTLVEPQSSGIGGGAFMLYHDSSSQLTTSYDGRETAPAGATPNLFLNEEGNPLPFFEAVRSGKSVGTPGILAMLKQAHNSYGSLPWSTLFEPAIKAAKEGFVISPRLQTSIEYASQKPTSDTFKALYLNEDGSAKKAGSLLKNPELASSLTAIATQGISAFYDGELAKDIATIVQENDGTLNEKDLANYQSKERAPVCAPYRTYRICSMDQPSSGGITLLETLGIAKHFELSNAYNAYDLHILLEAEKIAFADRNRYLADPDMGTEVRAEHLLDPRYLASRAAQISLEKASLEPAQPGGFAKVGIDNSVDAPSTTHISIIDGAGNAVSMTSSVEHSFGSALMAGGFVLNNQLTDFAFEPTSDGEPVANAVAPNKRPRSSMTPTLIFDQNNKLYAVLGSPGGSSIIPYVRKTINALIDWQLSPQEAITAPHFMHKNTKAEFENMDEILQTELSSLAHEINVRPHTSGLGLIIQQADGTLVGVADPRREGFAVGR